MLVNVTSYDGTLMCHVCEMALLLEQNLLNFPYTQKCENFIGASVVKGLRDTKLT